MTIDNADEGCTAIANLKDLATKPIDDYQKEEESDSKRGQKAQTFRNPFSGVRMLEGKPELTKDQFDRKQNHTFRSRKFYMLCGLVTVSSGFLWAKRMNAEEWINFNRWVFGIYAAGNVTTKAADAWKENGMKNPIEGLLADPQQQMPQYMMPPVPAPYPMPPMMGRSMPMAGMPVHGMPMGLPPLSGGQPGYMDKFNEIKGRFDFASKTRERI